MKRLNVLLILLVALSFAMPATISCAATEGSKTQKELITEKISVNMANADTLVQVPGIGPKTAEKIVSYRSENGNFNTLNELTNVKGIGDKSFQKMKPYLKL